MKNGQLCRNVIGQRYDLLVINRLRGKPSRGCLLGFFLASLCSLISSCIWGRTPLEWGSSKKKGRISENDWLFSVLWLALGKKSSSFYELPWGRILFSTNHFKRRMMGRRQEDRRKSQRLCFWCPSSLLQFKELSMQVARLRSIMFWARQKHGHNGIWWST